jgi:hypothetical protein
MMFERAATTHSVRSENMEQPAVDVLLIGQSSGSWAHLAKALRPMGFRCWLGSTPEEIRALLDLRQFGLVLSAQPITPHTYLMPLLEAPGRNIFYSVPVDGSCLWIQAFPENASGRPSSALRPSEFMAALKDLVPILRARPRCFPARKKARVSRDRISAPSSLVA